MHAGRYDLVVCSEVFEHVPAAARAGASPASSSCCGPAACSSSACPTAADGETVEHFPDLHDYEVVDRDGSHVLRNTTRDGRLQEYTDLIFHGGPGETLELRMFALPTCSPACRPPASPTCACAASRTSPTACGGPGWDGWPITARRPRLSQRRRRLPSRPAAATPRSSPAKRSGWARWGKWWPTGQTTISAAGNRSLTHARTSGAIGSPYMAT